MCIIQAFSDFKQLSTAEQIAYKFYLRREKIKKQTKPKNWQS